MAFYFVEPCRLVMINNKCFYCDIFSDENRHILVDRHLGIVTCMEHRENALRDCKAYMHKKSMVHLKDFMENELASALIAALGDNLQIIRSNGDKQDGWQIEKVSYEYIPHLFKLPDGKWGIRLVKDPDTDQCVVKGYRLDGFLDNRLKHSQTEGLGELIMGVTKLLDEGFYKSNADAQANRTLRIPDPYPPFNLAITSRGEVGRIYDPSHMVRG